MTDEYLYDFDNPYRILAHHVVGFYRPADVLRILTDNSYIFTLIQKEVRGLDIAGAFLDCAIEGILADKKRMDYMHQLDMLAKYYYSQIDRERLRKEIRIALSEIGVIVPDYSTGGNDSSATTYESPVLRCSSS